MEFGLQALERLNLIDSKPELELPMYPRIDGPTCYTSFVWDNPDKFCAGFTQSEVTLHGAIIILIMFAFFAPLTAAAIAYFTISYVTNSVILAGYAVAAFATLSVLIATMLIAYDDWKNEGDSDLELAAALVAIIPEFASFVFYIIGTLSWGAAAYVSTIWVAEKATLFNPVGLAVWAGIMIGVIVASLLELDNALRDWND